MKKKNGREAERRRHEQSARMMPTGQACVDGDKRGFAPRGKPLAEGRTQQSEEPPLEKLEDPPEVGPWQVRLGFEGCAMACPDLLKPTSRYRLVVRRKPSLTVVAA